MREKERTSRLLLYAREADERAVVCSFYRIHVEREDQPPAAALLRGDASASTCFTCFTSTKALAAQGSRGRVGPKSGCRLTVPTKHTLLVFSKPGNLNRGLER